MTSRQPHHHRPRHLRGQPVIRGTRVPLRTVLGSLAEGDTVEQIVKSFPSLTEEIVRGVMETVPTASTLGELESASDG
ncbi:MAG TPA: DUF433 domain-containing protein [Phycisphaerae bacterium]|nr:DUF433 domain-containing protein [Phycisphaerae bacterium]